MKRLGWEKKNTDQIIPYRYMIRSYKNDEYICGVSNDNVKLTGFNNNNDLTTRATKTNTGQITEYPFKIDETLKIASTHGQWYQLDMEDPEVTVWYCLSDNENGDPCAWAGTASNGDGTGATYGASRMMPPIITIFTVREMFLFRSRSFYGRWRYGGKAFH